MPYRVTVHGGSSRLPMPGQAGGPPGRRLAFVGLKWAQQLDERGGALGRLVPHGVAGVRRDRQVLQPAHGRHELAEPRTGTGRTVLRKSTVVVILGIEFVGVH
ncbi:hypothetical protein MRGA423_02235 [Mycobacterium tuberculosis RGTB423]|nr:hypothetical protein MRGA423_02235 [Mycobacterium tuberculosis RGTB423]